MTMTKQSSGVRAARVERAVRQTSVPKSVPAGRRGRQVRSRNDCNPRWKGARSQSQCRSRPTHKAELAEEQRAVDIIEPGHEGTAKVTRVCNEIWAATTLSLSFVHLSNLATDTDTETIALNLMDYIIKEENWNSELSYNKLSASAFLFACRVTGTVGTAQSIAASFEHISSISADAILGAMADPTDRSDLELRNRIIQALTMSAEDVESGYDILWEQRNREAFQELIGEYWVGLDNMCGNEEQLDRRGTEEVSRLGNDGKAKEQSLIDPRAKEAEEESIDLDEFELAVADNE